jgi:hypothetical protein
MALKPIPIEVGASYAFARHFDARVQVTFADILARFMAGPADHLTIGFYASFRP